MFKFVQTTINKNKIFNKNNFKYDNDKIKGRRKPFPTKLAPL